MLKSVSWMMSAKSGFSATVQTFGTNTLIAGLNVLTGIISARLLGPAGRGELAVIVIWPQLMAFSCSFGLPPSLLFNMSRHADRSNPLVTAAMLYTAMTGVLAMLVGALFLTFWLSDYSASMVDFARWAMITAPFPLYVVTFQSILQARKEFGLYNVLRVLQPLLTLLGLLFVLAIRTLNPFNAAVITLLPGVVITILMLARFTRIYHLSLEGIGWASRRLFSYGLRTYPSDLLGLLASEIDRVMVVGLLQPAFVGLYVVALSLAQLLNIFTTAISTILFPKAAGRSAEEVVALTGRAARVHFVVTLTAALVAAAIGPYALLLVYGEEFIGATTVFHILLLETVLRGEFTVLSQAMLSLDRPGLLSFVQAVGLTLTVVMIFLLVPRFGLEGAGLALLFGTITRVVFVLRCFPVGIGQPVPRLIANRADLAALWYEIKHHRHF